MTNNCKKCSSNNLSFVRYEMVNGVEILRKQCFDCGFLDSHSYKRTTVPDFYSLPKVDEQLRQQYKTNVMKLRSVKSVLFYYSEKYFKRQLAYYRNTYLNSEEWKHKRQVVMDYYYWKCQKCGDFATDLHHITYDNIFKEKFEDLQPLCRSCHKKEHYETRIRNIPTDS